MNAAPPVYRLVAWLFYRRSLCQWCRKEPRIDGRFCSAECEQAAAEAQAFG